ncbi:uncharacterized protein LOC124195010 [Daphnia pulex]|uniref:uncharacterized protein LOC124195010 n=1 Tax=Daphnia pulex TaxID=6669 RepID=UPI001EE0CF9B|nr:uncharacterized protein LOC124195010 [Daphnia pulex]
MASSNSECCAARSVHLRFQPDDECVDLFYNEVTVERTTSGSYFMVCGWSCGYFGIQQLTDDMKHNNKIALFSVWDPITGDDPHRVNPSDRVVVENVGCGVQVDRFGGEGTGAKLMAPLPWKLDETVACFVQAHREGHLSCYTGWIKRPGTDDWWRLGTLKTRAGGILLKHLYSFIEDFRRDVCSAHQNRQALFGNGWVRVGEKHPTRWRPLSTAHFTASDAEWEAKETIDAGTCTKGFYLSTGGDVCSSIDIGCRIDCSHIHCTPPTLPLP